MNKMREIRIEKVTLNVGAGKDQVKLKKGIKLLKNLTGIAPVQTHTQKRIAAWGLRPGLPIGCKLTMRGNRAASILKTLLTAKDNRITERQFDSKGNISFGIHEYIDVQDAKYDPEIGIMGFQVCVTLERPGFRVRRRRIGKVPVSHRHEITKDDAMEFMKNKFNVEVVSK